MITSIAVPPVEAPELDDWLLKWKTEIAKVAPASPKLATDEAYLARGALRFIERVLFVHLLTLYDIFGKGANAIEHLLDMHLLSSGNMFMLKADISDKFQEICDCLWNDYEVELCRPHSIADCLQIDAQILIPCLEELIKIPCDKLNFSEVSSAYLALERADSTTEKEGARSTHAVIGDGETKNAISIEELRDKLAQTPSEELMAKEVHVYADDGGRTAAEVFNLLTDLYEKRNDKIEEEIVREKASHKQLDLFTNAAIESKRPSNTPDIPRKVILHNLRDHESTSESLQTATFLLHVKVLEYYARKKYRPECFFQFEGRCVFPLEGKPAERIDILAYR